MEARAPDRHLVDLERISTPKERLLTFRVGSTDNEVLANAKKWRFDDAPVVDDKDRLIGIIPVAHVERLEQAGSMIDPADPEIYVHTLRDRESLLDFLDQMSTHRAAVIRDTDQQHDPDWFALVTVSDLNRHAFRAYLYPLLAELESNLADFIDASFPSLGDWLPSIPEDRRMQITELWDEAKRHQVDTSPVVYCNLMDLVNIVAKHSTLWASLGYDSRRGWDKATGFLGDFRNQVMHPVRPLILVPEDVTDLRKRVANMFGLIATVRTENGKLALDGAVMKRYMP